MDVINELYDEQKEMLFAFQSVNKLTIHVISGEERKLIHQKKYPNSLSVNDKTALYLAEKLDAMVLSGDKAVRRQAKYRAIEYHGMIWIFDQLAEASIISFTDAAEKLRTLIMTNLIYRNNKELTHAMNTRLKKWEGEGER